MNIIQNKKELHNRDWAHVYLHILWLDSTKFNGNCKNITGQSLPVKEQRSAEQPPLPCISSRKPIQGSETLAASLTSNARTARVDRRPRTLPNEYDKAVSTYVLKLKALRAESTLQWEFSWIRGLRLYTFTYSMWRARLRAAEVFILALASSSSSMILTGSESSLATKCSGVQPQRRRKAWENNTKRCWSGVRNCHWIGSWKPWISLPKNNALQFFSL